MKKLLVGFVVMVAAYCCPKISQANVVYTDLSSSPIIVLAAPEEDYTELDTGLDPVWDFGRLGSSFMNYNKADMKASYIAGAVLALDRDGVVAVLPAETPINSLLLWGTPAPSGFLAYTGEADIPGNWAGQSGYVGIRTSWQEQEDGDFFYQYGWIRMSVADLAHSYAIIITGYAYNNTPNGSLIAGSSAPEPSTMVLLGSLLGLGAIGGLRKRFFGAKKSVVA